MKLTEAKKAQKVIDAWLAQEKKNWAKNKLEFEANTRVVESEHSKGWWGVYIYTDGLSYDYLYTDEGYYLDATEAKEMRGYGAKDVKVGAQGGYRSKLEKHVLQKMGWNRNDHYFENYGEGIIMFY